MRSHHLCWLLLEKSFYFNESLSPLESVYVKNLIYHFPTCYAYSVKEPIGELNLKRALDEDTGVFSSFFSLLSSSPLGQTAISGNFTLHQWSWESLSRSWSSVNPWLSMLNLGALYTCMLINTSYLSLDVPWYISDTRLGASVLFWNATSRDGVTDDLLLTILLCHWSVQVLRMGRRCEFLQKAHMPMWLLK